MPWVAAVAPAAIGLVQTLSSNSKRRDEEENLEKMAKENQPNRSLVDYYNKALSKYNPNSYQSASFAQQSNQINRNLTGGISAAQNRRMGISAIGGLTQAANDAAGRAAGNAEMQQNRDLGQLGQAASVKSREDQRKFDIMYNMTAQKAGQYASTQNTGMRNLYNGLGSLASYYGGEEQGLDAPVGSKRYNRAWNKQFGDIWY